MMRVCQRQRGHLWESLRESLSVPLFTRAFLKSPSSRGLSAIAELLVHITHQSTSCFIAQLYGKRYVRRHARKKKGRVNLVRNFRQQNVLYTNKNTFREKVVKTRNSGGTKTLQIRQLSRLACGVTSQGHSRSSKEKPMATLCNLRYVQHRDCCRS